MGDVHACPRMGLPAPRAVLSCCSTVVCRRCAWPWPSCVLSCGLPGAALSPSLWEMPSAAHLSHTFPLRTADQERPTLFSSFLFPASSLSSSILTHQPSGLGSCFLSFPGALPGPATLPYDPDLLGFGGPLPHLLLPGHDLERKEHRSGSWVMDCVPCSASLLIPTRLSVAESRAPLISSFLPGWISRPKC